MEMKLSVLHFNARGQGHFRTVSRWPVSWSFTKKNCFFNNFSAIFLIQVSDERLQDQWSTGLFPTGLSHSSILHTQSFSVYNTNSSAGESWQFLDTNRNL